MKQGSRLDAVENPQVLCAASKQYAEPAYGFDLDVAVCFPMGPAKRTVLLETCS
jgi:hypothetical protein